MVKGADRAAQEASAISRRTLWQSLRDAARRFLDVPVNGRSIASIPIRGSAPAYRPLERVILTAEVSQTLFEEYANHRQTERGQEEIGWFLLGVRSEREATVLATLPAGAERSAGHAHVRFNSSAQALASRIVRQYDRRLTPLGVVHTHPGQLRHPSAGDLHGDRQWVGQLRGGQGVFGIGTADAPPEPDSSAGPGVSWQPEPHVQCLDGSRLTWYTLADGETRYRPVPVRLELGSDLARRLRPVWPVIERHADRLDRLARQLARVRFEIIAGPASPALAVVVPMPTTGEADEVVRVVLEGDAVRYFFQRGEDVFAPDLTETSPDRGVFLLLAELAGRA